MASTAMALSAGLRSARASSSRCTSSALRVRYASTAMRMPAMSPTMTEGGITSWKKEEGESFSAGDVLLEVETDKATIDVEAQDDGIMGKIVAQAGSNKIPVGQVIAMLAEEGDDLSSIEVPSDLGPESSSGSSGSSSASASAPAPSASSSESSASEAKEVKSESSSASGASTGGGGGSGGHKEVKHPKPLFPSVLRLLQESSLSSSEISKLKGTGRHGMLTKGDVLVALGQVKSPYGSAEKMSTDIMGPSGKRKSETTDQAKEGGKAAVEEKEEPLDGPSLRKLILAGMSRATRPAEPIVDHTPTNLPLSPDADFDALLAPYASLLPPVQPRIPIPTKDQVIDMESQGQGQPAKKDEWAGLM